MMYQQRRFTRVPIGHACTLVTEAGESVAGKMKDVSANGLSILCDRMPAVGTVCTIQAALDPDEEIEVRGTIVESRKDGVSIEVVGIRADSFKYWRELITRSAEDEYGVDTEITSCMDVLPDLY